MLKVAHLTGRMRAGGECSHKYISACDSHKFVCKIGPKWDLHKQKQALKYNSFHSFVSTIVIETASG